MRLNYPSPTRPAEELVARRPKRGRAKSPADPSRSTARGADEAIQYQLDTFRLLLDHLDVGAAVVTRNGVVQYSNPRFAELIAPTPIHPVNNSNLRSFVSANSWPALETVLRQSTRVPSEGQLEIEVVSGAKRTIRVAFFPLIRGEPDQLIGITTTEVTKLVEATQALQQSEASLQTLSARLLQVQDEERRHMARDLHDTIGQELAVAVMRVEQIAKDLGLPEAQVRKELADCSEWLRKIESETRTLSYVLHPPLLDQIGLVSALRWYIEGFSKRSGLRVDMDVRSSIPRLEMDEETALFRIVQESLTNVLRHSGSAEATVRVEMEDGAVRISVADKGKGFGEQTHAERARPRFGVGIQGMRGRLSLVKGTLDIQSSARGATVSARVPLGRSGRKSELEVPAMEPRPTAPAPAQPLADGGVARILIADDHEIARRGIRDLFRDERDMEICGEARDGVEALSKTEELHPDLLILDLSMPKLGGFSVANRLRRSDPSVKILVYSTHSHPDVERMARSLGCRGCVHKANAARDLVRGAKVILRGGEFYDANPQRAQLA